MLCPTCEYNLKKLSVTTDSGGKFDVDHCGRCGGTWFDAYEINRIPYHEVMRIADATVMPKKPIYSSHTARCPSCSTILEKYFAESIPAGLTFLRCPKDKGIWATQRTLEQFKRYQESTIKNYAINKAAIPSLSVVFVPSLMGILLLLSTFITLNSLQQAKDNRTRAQDQVRQVQVTPFGPSEVIVNFETKNPLRSEISYGTSSLDFTTQTISGTPLSVHKLLLTGLKSNTTYIYRITLIDQSGSRITTPDQTFQTPRDK